jgi:hypothetical protein
VEAGLSIQRGGRTRRSTWKGKSALKCGGTRCGAEMPMLPARACHHHAVQGNDWDSDQELYTLKSIEVKPARCTCT